jgi:hypothetical protein
MIDTLPIREHIRVHEDELHSTSPVSGRSGAPAMTLG